MLDKTCVSSGYTPPHRALFDAQGLGFPDWWINSPVWGFLDADSCVCGFLGGWCEGRGGWGRGRVVLSGLAGVVRAGDVFLVARTGDSQG